MAASTSPNASSCARKATHIRRGIYRDFPTRYKDRAGNRVVVGFQMIEVLRDGSPEPWFTETKRNGIRINTGNDDFLPTPAQFTFTLRYRTTRQLGFFDTHDELYWNAIGTGWDFPIESGSVEVRLPQAVPMDRMKAEGYTGAQGQQGQDYDARITEPGMARWLLTRPLAPREGFTVVLSFPKGLVTQPTAMQRWMWLLKDNRGVLIALAGLVALLLFCARRWHRVGRDPKPGVIITRYDPPAGYSPAGLRYMRRMSYDHLRFASDIVDMAVHGYLDIHEGGSSKTDGWPACVRVRGADAARLGESQRALAAKLFAGGDEIVLKNTEASRVSGAIMAQVVAITRKLKPRYFIGNGGSLLLGILFSFLVGAVAVAVSAGTGVLALVVLSVLGLAAHIIFAFLLKAPTAEGRKLLDEIEGLRLYLGVAERDELKSLKGPAAAGGEPALDAGRYEALLPYAMALEVEQAWTGKFVRAVGDASARETSAVLVPRARAPGHDGAGQHGFFAGHRAHPRDFLVVHAARLQLGRRRRRFVRRRRGRGRWRRPLRPRAPVSPSCRAGCPGTCRAAARPAEAVGHGARGRFRRRFHRALASLGAPQELVELGRRRLGGLARGRGALAGGGRRRRAAFGARCASISCAETRLSAVS